MRLLRPVTLASKIHLAIFVNVILAIMLGEYLVTHLLGLSGITGILVNLGVNSILAFLYGRFVSRAITRPIHRVTDMLEDINTGQGDLTKRLSIETGDEIGQLSRSFNSFLDKLHHIITDLVEVASSVSASVAYFTPRIHKVSATHTPQNEAIWDTRNFSSPPRQGNCS